MITYKVFITKKADTDETVIYNYISNEFGKTYADNFRRKVVQILSVLAKHPFLGRPAKNNPSLRVELVASKIN